MIYSITSFYSSGYFHPDEHYQIIEFAGLLDGSNQPDDLAWEFQSKIRSSIQPYFAFYVFKIAEFISITDPFMKAFMLRLITAICWLILTYHFVNACRNLIEIKNFKVFVLLSYFLWFLPFLNVRFSSESWSGLFLLWSAIIIIKGNRNIQSYIIIGLLLGISFLMRFQIAISIVAFIMWLLFIRKEKIQKIVALSLGFSIIFFTGLIADFYFYGEWTVASWNYFYINIIEGKAASFGVDPWYYFLAKILFYTIPPISIIVISSFIRSSIFLRKNPLIWLIIPFVFIHFLISHKELRFLFPIINFLPLMVVISWQVLEKKYVEIKKTFAFKILFILCIGLNTLFLVFSTTRPAGNGFFIITEKIHELNDKERINIFYTTKHNPTTQHSKLTNNFYKENQALFFNLNVIEFEKFDSFKNPDYRNVLVIDINDLKDESIQKPIRQLNLKEVTTSVPKFLFRYYRDLDRREKTYILYSD